MIAADMCEIVSELVNINGATLRQPDVVVNGLQGNAGIKQCRSSGARNEIAST